MEERTDIWLSGNENLRLIDELLEPHHDNDGRQSGRTSKLALKYAQLALRAPGSRIILRDHHSTNDSHWRMQVLVCSLLDALKIDYQVGSTKEAEVDPGSFTGVRLTGHQQYYVIALPKLPTR
jgi:hypothetical protein